MPADATVSSPAPSAPVSPRADSFDERADRLVESALQTVEGFVAGAWHVLRFIVFGLYLVLVVLNFWLWMVSAIFGLLRFVVRAAMVLLLWLSGGYPPRGGTPPGTIAEGIRRDLHELWQQRLRAYESLAQPVARHFVSARFATRTFWCWPIRRKVASLLAAILFIGLPATYVVPRPHYVQVTDDNAIDYGADGSVRYFVHAVDMYTPDRTREYLNEDAPWLGKINSQGLKSQLVPGRNYRFWVVGIRWYWMPRLFPNIIAATEVDAEGRAVSNPSRLAAPAQLPP